MNTNEKAALRYSGEAAHEKPPTTPSSMTEGTPRRKSTRRRGPGPWRSLSALVRDELLGVFLEMGSRP